MISDVTFRQRTALRSETALTLASIVQVACVASIDETTRRAVLIIKPGAHVQLKDSSVR